jgi:hypothetical protein
MLCASNFDIAIHTLRISRVRGWSGFPPKLSVKADIPRLMNQMSWMPSSGIFNADFNLPGEGGLNQVAPIRNGEGG